MREQPELLDTATETHVRVGSKTTSVSELSEVAGVTTDRIRSALEKLGAPVETRGNETRVPAAWIADPANGFWRTVGGGTIRDPLRMAKRSTQRSRSRPEARTTPIDAPSRMPPPPRRAWNDSRAEYDRNAL